MNYKIKCFRDVEWGHVNGLLKFGLYLASQIDQMPHNLAYLKEVLPSPSTSSSVPLSAFGIS